jgi:hypothetical protein
MEKDKPVSIDTETRALPTVPVTGTHTPGPWQLWHDDEGAFVLRSPDDEKVICKRDLGLPDRDEGIANAHLIAAAPDLLEALRAMSPDTEQARAAIAKAEGRP